ncbi:beta strand repeat-containing protein [Marinomonas gallaica]|uniref:beta strand repeat-containing protein n=1 Tax=Marinomonas gallaica TaxID=1806667 RepID=UPI003CE53101
MATVTGTNLLDGVLADLGVTLSATLQSALAARLQSAIDAGTASSIQVAAVLASNPTIAASVPAGETPLTSISSTVTTVQTEIEADNSGLPLAVESFAAAENSVVEGNGVDFTVTMNKAVEVDTTFTYQVQGVTTSVAAAATPVDDLGVLNGTVTILAGETTGTFTLTPAADGITEGFEAFKVVLLDENNEAAQESGNILIKDPTNAGQSFVLTSNVDEFTGGAGNDTFRANYDLEAGAGAGAHTLSTLDAIDGGAGEDVLNITSDNGTNTYTLAAASVSNVETISIQGSDDVVANVSGSTFSGVETLASTKSIDSTLTAAATTDISVSGATGAIVVNGGKDVVVTDSAANNNISVGDTTESAGTVTVTDTNQGTGNIVVEGGTDVTVNATVAGTTADVTGGTINVGNNTDQPTGTIKVTQTNTNTGSSIAGTAGTPEVHTLTITADGSDDGDESLTINYDTNGNQILDGQVVVNDANIDFTDASAVASAAAALIDADPTVNASASGAVITINQTVAGDSIEPTAVAGGTTNSLAGVSATLTPGAAAVPISFADVNAGAINVQGGTSIDITVDSTSTAAAATADGDITNGTVTATAGNATESISVVQNNTATAQTEAATSLVGGTQTVTFKALASGQSVTVAGLTFTAAKALTAAEVASAFADLTAVDTQSNGTTAQGIYTNDVDANITSGAANGSVVVFTNTSSTAAPTLNLASSANPTSLPTAVATSGTAATAADTSSNTVTAGNVVLNDNATASVKDITVSTFGTATLGTTNGFDVLETLSLTNSNGATTLDTAATTLTVNLDNVDHTVSLDSGAATIANLTINTSGTASTGAITAAAAETVTINAEAALSGASTYTAATLIDVNGSASVDLTGATTNAVTLETIDASGNAGGVTAVLGGTNAVAFTGGAGNDSLTLGAAAIASGDNIDLGAGDDTLVIATGTNASTINATVTGGAGTDTLSMGYTDAVAVSANTDFDAEVTDFERLTINNFANNADGSADTHTVNLGNLTYDYVTVSGSDNGVNTVDTLALTNAAANSTVAFRTTSTANSLTTVALADATGTADALNFVLASTNQTNVVNGVDVADQAAGTANNAGTVTADAVETFNITSSAADADGATNVITANGDAVTTINVSGNAGVDLTSSNTTTLKAVDASGLTAGGLTFTADSANMTVTGGAGNDTITINGTADSSTFSGGAGNDTFVISTGADLVTINGGTGNDTFDFDGVSTNKSNYVVINGGVNTGDVFDFAGLVATDFNAAQITLAQGATESTQAYLDQAMTTLAAGELGWFQYNGNTYIAMDDGAVSNNSFADGEDLAIMITGLVDLSTATFNTTSDTLEIA